MLLWRKTCITSNYLSFPFTSHKPGEEVSKHSRPVHGVGLLQPRKTVGVVVVRLASITFAATSNAALALRRPRRLVLAQCFRFEQLAVGRIGRTLKEGIVAIANIGEMVKAPWIGKHVKRQRVNCSITPLITK
jgi:hypothetical protein